MVPDSEEMGLPPGLAPPGSVNGHLAAAVGEGGQEASFLDSLDPSSF